MNRKRLGDRVFQCPSIILLPRSRIDPSFRDTFWIEFLAASHSADLHGCPLLSSGHPPPKDARSCWREASEECLCGHVYAHSPSASILGREHTRRLLCDMVER